MRTYNISEILNQSIKLQIVLHDLYSKSLGHTTVNPSVCYMWNILSYTCIILYDLQEIKFVLSVFVSILGMCSMNIVLGMCSIVFVLSIQVCLYDPFKAAYTNWPVLASFHWIEQCVALVKYIIAKSRRYLKLRELEPFCSSVIIVSNNLDVWGWIV